MCPCVSPPLPLQWLIFGSFSEAGGHRVVVHVTQVIQIVQHLLFNCYLSAIVSQTRVTRFDQDVTYTCKRETLRSRPVLSFLCSGGRNSSVGSAWARCPQCRGFDPPLGTFSGRGDFSLGVNMGSNSIPPKTPSDESINRGLVCAHMHFIARTQKILTFMS